MQDRTFFRFEWRPRLTRLFAAITAVLVTGTIGYMLIEGWDWDDAFYMTAITVSTVGFGEIWPLSPEGRLFTIALIFLGVGVIAYGFTTFSEYLVTTSVGGQLRERRVKRMIEKLENHIIICGYGRVGKSASDSLAASKRQMVVIERDPDAIVEAYDAGYLVIEGDATRDETLHRAGIDRAWGMAVCTGDDTQNLFVVLSARSLSTELYIVARSVEAENERKMRRVGANRVVSPYQIGGKHMANIIMRPHVTDFFDVVTLDDGLEIWVEELVIAQNSALIGKTVGTADIRRKTGVTIVALYHRAADATVMPDADTVMQPGDELIVLGTRQQLSALETLTGKQPDVHVTHVGQEED